MWLWNPEFGELRLETNATLLLRTIEELWRKARIAPEAAEGLQPVVRLIDRVQVLIKNIGKKFFALRVEIVGWVPRSDVPGWAARTPTVPPPKAAPALPAGASPVAIAKETAKAPDKGRRQHKAKRPGAKQDPDDSISDILPGE
jgi:hypothetical protein